MGCTDVEQEMSQKNERTVVDSVIHEDEKFPEKIENQVDLKTLVGKKVRAIRTERGLSLRALAESSGLNINTLSLIENNKMVSLYLKL